MATVTGAPATGVSRSRRAGVAAWIVLALAAVYFVGPILASFWFSIHSGAGFSFHAYTSFFTAPGFAASFGQSAMLAVSTVVITIVLMVPTMVFVKLRLPQAARYIELLSLMPLVVPPVALVVGVRAMITWAGSDSLAGTPIAGIFNWLQGDPPWLLALVYVVMAMPFTFRAIDAGLQGADLNTLVEASRNLGGSWPQTLWLVVMPALRTAVLNASLLAFALVLGEYTIAKILSFTTFPVWLAQFGKTDGQVQVALSLLSLLVIWGILVVLSLIGSGPGRGRRRQESGS